MAKILIVEDDNFISDVLKRLLEDAGYTTDQAFSGTEALRVLKENSFELILLDLMLPGLNGEEVIKEIKAMDAAVPVIVISAKNDVSSRIQLFKLGADDFIQKPFDNEEVLLRISAVLRRVKQEKVEVVETLRFDDLTLDLNLKTLFVGSKEVPLTNYEFQLLKELMERPNWVFTKKNLYYAVWGYEGFSDENVINIHLSNIRKKMKKVTSKEYIKTIWGLGIKMNDQ
ncbi:response regulator transcription factor [Guggenheimella bovis]